MSMSLMVKAMNAKVGNPLRKLVLIKLADNASDTGECWPSYQHIADQCEISRRSVMTHIDALCEGGLLRKEVRKGGPKGNLSNVYILTLGGESPALGVVKEIHHPSAADSPPPSESPAPRTSHSLEPVIEPKAKAKARTARPAKFDPMTCKPEGVSDVSWAGFCEMRKGKGKALTQHACNLIAQKLQGHANPSAVVDLSTENGWSGVFPESQQVSRHENRPASSGGRTLSAADRVKQAIAEREARETSPNPVGYSVDQDGRDVRPPLDGEFRRVG